MPAVMSSRMLLSVALGCSTWGASSARPDTCDPQTGVCSGEPEESSMLQRRTDEGLFKVGLHIINGCGEDIVLRTPRMDQVAQDDSNGDYQLIRQGETLKFEPQDVVHNKVVLAWQDANETKCHNGVFCQEIELSGLRMTTGAHPNFVNQLAYTDMAVGAAFFSGGQPALACPQGVVNKCRQIPGHCVSTAGRFDKCMHDISQCTSDVGIKVELKAGGHQYCMAPDTNKAIISVHLDNPTKQQCLEPFPNNFLCKGNCKDLTNSTTGSTGTWCSGARYDIKVLMQTQGLSLINSANGLPLTQDDLDNVEIGGAKAYQTTVSAACGNQAPAQRAKTGANGLPENDQAPEYDRNFDQVGYLDHAITYTGDDANMWEIQGQQYPGRGIFMAGSVGMQCDGQTWDTFVIKACPKSSD